MSEEYVSRVLLEIDSQNIEDFEEVEEGDVELAKAVELMNKIGTCELLPKYSIKVKYAIPKDADEFDFNSVKNGRLTIDRKNGMRIVYTGVTRIKIGATKYGKDVATKEIEFIATDRDPKLGS